MDLQITIPLVLLLLSGGLGAALWGALTKVNSLEKENSALNRRILDKNKNMAILENHHQAAKDIARNHSELLIEAREVKTDAQAYDLFEHIVAANTERSRVRNN